MNTQQYTIGKFLLHRLEQLGLGHIFGVPGDYIFDLLHLLPESNIKYIGACNELNAGYAADAYARFRGIGGVLVTYAVGGFSVVNAVAGAYAEKVPMIVISGGPELKSYDKQPQQHHILGDYSIPLEVFEKITIASACILDPESAATTIDDLLKACVLYKRPIYLEIPCDIVNYPCRQPDDVVFANYVASKPDDLMIAFNATIELLNNANQPIIIVGNEIQRFELQGLTEELLSNTGFAFSTFITDKTAMSEQHPQFIGPCGPGIKMESTVKEFIEYSDCILCFGSVMSNNHLQNFMPNLNIDKMMSAFDNKVHIKGKIYDVSLHELIKSLNEHFKQSKNKPTSNVKSLKCQKHAIASVERLNYQPKNKMTNAKFFERLSVILKDDDILIVDSGSSLFTARKLSMPSKSSFLAQSYYSSLGYSLAATLGAALATPKRRIIVVVGDGAFQFTCQELSTLIRYGLSPIIFVINNAGYTIERILYTDAAYNDIQPWSYHKIPLVFGGNAGCEVRTEEDLESALEWSQSNTGVSLIEVHLDKLDYCNELVSNIEP